MSIMTLKTGQQAPDFTLPATDYETIALKELKGQTIRFVFLSKRRYARLYDGSLRVPRHFNALKAIGVTVLGVSKDSVKSHDKFKEKYKLNFPLLSDEDGNTLNALYVWVEKSMMGRKYMGIERSTFLIDGTGKIAQIWRNVKVADHVAEVVDAARKLQQQQKAA
jgi:peroxiredoxin Q/BCP